MSKDNSALKAYGDIVMVTGKYEDKETGKEKNRYQKVGMMLATPHFSRIVLKLDAAPITGDGWLTVFKRDDFGQNADSSEEKDGVDF